MIGAGLRGIVLVLLAALPAADAAAATADWASFRLRSIGVFQDAGNSLSGGLSWAPIWRFAEELGVRGQLGATLHKGFSNRFVALEAEVHLAYEPLTFLALEAGGGLQYWLSEGEGGAAPTIAALASWNLEWGPLAGIFVGYTLFLPRDNPTHQVLLGATLAFGAKRSTP